MVFKSPIPDLIIGLLVVGIVIKGGWEILGHTRMSRRAGASAHGAEHEWNYHN